MLGNGETVPHIMKIQKTNKQANKQTKKQQRTKTVKITRPR